MKKAFLRLLPKFMISFIIVMVASNIILAYSDIVLVREKSKRTLILRDEISPISFDRKAWNRSIVGLEVKTNVEDIGEIPDPFNSK